MARQVALLGPAHVYRGVHSRPVSIPLYQVDAFTSEPFAGNPAAVCLVEHEPSEAWM